MREVEGYQGYQKGWWWMAQLLIAEQKCTQRPRVYKAYCDDFIEFLGTYVPPAKDTKRWSSYGTR